MEIACPREPRLVVISLHGIKFSWWRSEQKRPVCCVLECRPHVGRGEIRSWDVPPLVSTLIHEVDDDNSGHQKHGTSYYTDDRGCLHRMIGWFMEVAIGATRGCVGEHLATGSIRATEANINKVQVSGSRIRS